MSGVSSRHSLPDEPGHSGGDHSTRHLIEKVASLEAEVERLQGMIKHLTDRIAAQSELLSSRAEK